MLNTKFSPWPSFSKKEAKISKIFDWYGEDFPDVMGFIKK